jgi:hypothetical protein
MLRIPRGESCQGRCIHILAPLKLFRVISRVNQFETARIADGYLSRGKIDPSAGCKNTVAILQPKMLDRL